MAAPVSTVLSHPQRLEIDAALSNGQLTISEVAVKFGLSRTSLYRYRASHLAPLFREQLASELGNGPGLIERLVAIAEDARQARLALLEEGKVALHATAANAETKAIEVLLDRLGIDDADVAESFREQRAVAAVIGRLVDAAPKTATWLARELETVSGGHAVAQAIQKRLNERELKS